MDDTESQSALGNQSFGKRLRASLPGILIFAVLLYFSVGAADSGVRSSAPLWLRLPFFLYCGLTVLFGLQVFLHLVPVSRTIESARSLAEQFVGWLFSLFCLGAAIGMIFLLVRFPMSYTSFGVALFSSVACVLFVASLLFPFKVIRRRLKPSASMRPPNEK